MQDATISGEQERGHSGFPSLLTQDDLVMEIGRQVIGTRNLEKLVMQLGAQVQELTTKAESTAAALSEATRLKESNKQLSDKNKSLDAALTGERKKRQEVEAALKAMRGRLSKCERELVKLQTKKKAKRNKKVT